LPLAPVTCAVYAPGASVSRSAESPEEASVHLKAPTRGRRGGCLAGAAPARVRRKHRGARRRAVEPERRVGKEARDREGRERGPEGSGEHGLGGGAAADEAHDQDVPAGSELRAL